MKRFIFLLFLWSMSLCLASCSIITKNADEQYQPVGTAVLVANGLLMANQDTVSLDKITGNQYKELLKEDYKPSYEKIIPYTIVFNNTINGYIVSVYDGETLILTDWLCTEGRIDCWSYNGECRSDVYRIKCD